MADLEPPPTAEPATETPSNQSPTAEIAPKLESVPANAAASEKIREKLDQLDFASPAVEQYLETGTVATAGAENTRLPDQAIKDQRYLRDVERERSDALAQKLADEAVATAPDDQKEQVKTTAERLKNSVGRGGWDLRLLQNETEVIDQFMKRIATWQQQLKSEKDPLTIERTKNELQVDSNHVAYRIDLFQQSASTLAPELLAASGITDRIAAITGQPLIEEPPPLPENKHLAQLLKLAYRKSRVVPADREELQRKLSFRDPPPLLSKSVETAAMQPAKETLAKNLLSMQQAHPEKIPDLLQQQDEGSLHQAEIFFKGKAVAEADGRLPTQQTRDVFSGYAAGDQSTLSPQRIAELVLQKAGDNQKQIGQEAGRTLLQLTMEQSSTDTAAEVQRMQQIAWITSFLEIAKLGFDTFLLLGKVALEQAERKKKKRQ